MKQYIIIVAILFLSLFIFGQENDNYLNGLAKIHYQEYDSAITYFSKALSSDKNTAKLYLHRGECYFILDSLNEAKKNYNSAEKLESGIASFNLARINAIQENFDEALKWIEINLKSEYKIAKSEIRTNDAFIMLRETGEWEQLWLKDWYSEQEIIFESAEYLKKRKKYVDALEELDKLIFQDKNNAHLAYYKRAEVYLLLNDNRNALSDLNSAIKINSDNFIYYYQRANLLMKSRKFKKAFADYNKVIDLNDENFEAFYKRALVEKKLQLYNEAINDLKFYLKYMDKHEIAYYKGGLIYLNVNKYDEAKAWLDKAIKMNLNKVEYYIARVDAYEGLKNYMSMSDDCTQALDLNPNEGILYFKRGIAKYNLKDKDGACKDWQKAIKYNYFEANEYMLNDCQ